LTCADVLRQHHAPKGPTAKLSYVLVLCAHYLLDFKPMEGSITRYCKVHGAERWVQHHPRSE
jgi:hypothetical protein